MSQFKLLINLLLILLRDLQKAGDIAALVVWQQKFIYKRSISLDNRCLPSEGTHDQSVPPPYRPAERPQQNRHHTPTQNLSHTFSRRFIPQTHKGKTD